MIQYKAFELHCHTKHSDGVFTLEKLCETAREYHYDGIALTDHNTMSAFDGLSPELMCITPVITGIEWTTYFGHMAVIAADEYVDWRFATPDDIDVYLEKIRKVNGVAGIVHPFHPGSPMCTGCYWDFKVKNWKNVSYIEIWNEPFPHSHFKNELAFQWWTELLNQGHRLAGTSGRDWHRRDTDPKLTTVTYLGLENGEISNRTVRDALSGGRTFVSCGPCIGLGIENSRGSFGIGDEIIRGTCNVEITLDESQRRAVWEQFRIKTRELRLVNNGKVVRTFPADSAAVSFEMSPEPGWLRVEGYGDYQDEKMRLVCFTSPVYIVEP